MLIDLFSSTELMTVYERVGNQTLSRGYKTDKAYLKDAIDKLRVSNITNKDEIIKRLCNPRREVINNLGVYSDSLAELECLGIAVYCREYTIVIDLADQLDLVLFVLCGCNIDNIRSIPNYVNISREILKFNKDKLSFNDILEIINIDNNIRGFFEDILFRITSKYYTKNVSKEFIYKKSVIEFLSEILKMSVKIQDYICADIIKWYSAVYRSRSLAKSVLTCDIKVDSISISYNGLTRGITTMSLNRLEYLEVIDIA